MGLIITPTLSFTGKEAETWLILTYTSQKLQAEFALSVLVLSLGTVHGSQTYMYSLKPCHYGKEVQEDLQEGTQKNQIDKYKQQKKTETNLECKYVLFSG